MLVRCPAVTHGFALCLLVCFCTQFASAQVGTRQQPSAIQPPASQSRQVQLTPEQQKAQRDAAQRAYAEHLRQAEESAKRSIQPPKGFPLPKNHADYVAQLLDHWQKVSDQVEAYKCKFQRYDYDSAIVNYRDPQSRQLAAYQVAFGEIRYAAKDKASFETNLVKRFKSPPKTPQENPVWEDVEGNKLFGKTIHERWICDGQSVFDFDFVGKRMYETKIPRELQGNVVESPLPFLFGANKQDIMTRFWVRYVPKYRKNAQGEKELIQDEYWLEAYPKKINDARMYSKLDIILAAKDFMPIAIHMYSPQYDGAENFESRYFYFRDREVNGGFSKLQNFFGSFVKPKLPFGWEAVTRNMNRTAQGPSTESRK